MTLTTDRGFYPADLTAFRFSPVQRSVEYVPVWHRLNPNQFWPHLLIATCGESADMRLTTGEISNGWICFTDPSFAGGERCKACFP